MNRLEQRVIEHAALSGNFLPSRFLYDAGDHAERALSTLAPLCYEVAVGQNIYWRMHNADRSRVLRSIMAAPGRLNQRLRKRGPLAQDFFAQVLEKCLRNDVVPTLSDLPKADPLQMSRMFREAISATIAAQTVVDTERRAELEDFEKALYRSSVKHADDVRRKIILPGKLCGRVEERQAALDFLHDTETQDLIQTLSDAAPRDAKSLLVLGAPGLGKSAFLTDLADRISQQIPSPWVLRFDFDQMTLLHGDLIAWTEEATRQLALQLPEFAPGLNTLRRTLASNRTVSYGDTDLSESDLLINGALQILSPAEQRPLVILIDTIEELVSQNVRDLFETSPTSTAFYALVEWVDRIGRLNGDLPTHAIYSGRIPPPLDPAQLGDWFTARMDLSDLSTSAAQELLNLRDPQMPDATCKALVSALGGHPLHLIIAQNHIKNLPEKERVQVVDDLNQVGLRGLPPDEVLQSLYTRFLARMRVHNPKHGVTAEMVEALAHPGLLLRKVTIPILTHVIAPSVGVDLSNPERATEAFRILRDQVWLVNAASGGQVITHRRDVRRIMLPLMVSRQRTPEVEAVFRNAISYFKETGDRESECYTRALAGEYRWALDDPELAATVFGVAGHEEVETFDIAVRAHLKHFSPSGGELSSRELAALSDELALSEASGSDTRQIRATGSSSMSADKEHRVAVQGNQDGGNDADPRKPGRARIRRKLMDEIARLGDAGLTHEILNHRTLQQEIEIAFIEADFESVVELGWKTILAIREWPDLSRPLGLNWNFRDHWLWRLTLASLAPVSKELDQYIEAAIERFASSSEVKRVLKHGVLDLTASFLDFEMLMSSRFATAYASDFPNIWSSDNNVSFSQPRGANFRIQRVYAQSMLFQMHGTKNHIKLNEASIDEQTFLSQIFNIPLSSEFFQIALADSSDKNRDLERAVAFFWQTDRLDPQLYEKIENSIFNDTKLHRTFIAKVEIMADEVRTPQDRALLNQVIRGQTPELHMCVAGLVSNHSTSPASIFDCIAKRAPIWPTAAQQAQAYIRQAKRGSRSGHDAALELVRFTDLCGLLTELIEHMAELPDGSAVERVAYLNRVLDTNWAW